MPLITTQLTPAQKVNRARKFEGNWFQNLKVNLSGSNTNGQTNGLGKVWDIGLPIVGGIIGGYYGGAAGAKLGVTAGNFANKGLNAWGANILEGTDAEELQKLSTQTEERNDSLVSMAGNLAGSISSGISDATKSFNENKVLDEAIGGASDASLESYLQQEGMDPALMSSVARRVNGNKSRITAFDRIFGDQQQNQFNWTDFGSSLMSQGQQAPVAPQAGYSVPGQPNSSILPNPNPNSNIRFLDDAQQQQMFPTGFAGGGVTERWQSRFNMPLTPEAAPGPGTKPVAPGRYNSRPLNAQEYKTYVQDVRNFYTDYLLSPKYLQRLKAGGYEDPQDTKMTRLLNNFKANPQMLPASNTNESFYEHNRGIFLNPKDLKGITEKPQDVLAHEYSHEIGAGNPNSQLSPADLDLISGANKFRKAPYDKITSGNIQHDKDPNEMKAAVDNLRYRMMRDGLYDAGKQNFTPDHWQKAKNKYGDYYMLENLFKAYKKEDLIKIMNTVASNQQPIERFVDGGSPEPYEIYPEHDKTTEDYYMVDKEEAHTYGLAPVLEKMAFGQARYGERIYDQHSNIVQRAIARSNMDPIAKRLALGDHILTEIKTHRDFAGIPDENGYAGGSVVTPKEMQPQVLRFQKQYNEFARKNNLKAITEDGKFGPQTMGAIDNWNKSNPHDFEYQLAKTNGKNTLAGMRFQDITVDPETDLIGRPETQPLTTSLPGANKAKVDALASGTAPTGEKSSSASTPAPGKTLTPYQRQNLFGNLSDLATAGIGAVVGTKGIPRYTPTDEYLKMRDEVYARKDQGFSPEEQASINQGLQNNYATSLNAIRNLTGGGGTAGLTLAAVNNASADLNSNYLKTAVQNVLQRRQNFQNYQGAVMNDMAVDQNIFEQDRENALAQQQAGLSLMDRSLQNIADRQNFNDQYGPDSNYAALSASFLAGTQAQEERANGIVNAYRRMVMNQAKGF